MQYAIDRSHYHDFRVVSINKLPPRSYFIPFETKAQADSAAPKEKRYVSPKVQCLSGQWDFAFYPRPAEVPEALDTEKVCFDTIAVPGCWQFQGYDRPFYVNVRYQFPYNPPEIPKEEPVGKVFFWHGSDEGIKPRWRQPEQEYNFVGIYRKLFTVKETAKRHILSFLGVASCLDLYINGQFAGYSEGSHNTAEFDITSLLVPGDNELVAVVHRWCNGTYLECQDMFRNNGIFRDVLLFEMEENDIWDVEFSAVKQAGKYNATVRARVDGQGDVTFSLCGQKATVSATNGHAAACFDGLDVTEWNAEKPTLYDLYIEFGSTCVKQRIGFKDVKIKEDVFTLNGQKLKLRGVNHHDTSPTGGYCLTPDEIERDILLCKRHNIDTIRTAHYPPDPLLLELCDEYGIYVVDENDLETHGTFAHQIPPSYNSITHDKTWLLRYMERIKHLYHRDKNRASILMWSLGNEAGGYHNTDAMYTWLKQHTTIPVHYESAIHSKRIAYDVGSEMYPSVENVRKVGQHQRKQKPLNDRPYFLCEYAHAMGVGPGAAEDYWKEIYAFDNLMGGCVWEMVDHAVLQGDGRYTYGGDHGEWEHDRNFCVDGLFYPDRTPSTGAKSIRHIYRPLRVSHLGGNRYEVFNACAFTDAGEFQVEFRFFGGEIVCVPLRLPPLSKSEIEVPSAGEMVTIVVSKDGREVSREQIVFSHPVLRDVATAGALPAWFDIRDGIITIEKDGKKLLSGDPHTLLFRAPTDNDVDLLGINTMAAHICQEESLLGVTIQAEKVELNWAIRCKKQEFICTDTYENTENGILLTSRLHCTKGSGDLPRFGKAFRLEESFREVTYFGRNGESYRDMAEHTQVEQVNCTVSDMVEPNIRPQESGNRMDCSWVRISDSETAFSFTAVDKPFELGIKPYSDRALLRMTHREDEVYTGTYVTLSAFQMGIGTGSCGPTTRKEYRFDCKKDYEIKFIIA